MARGSRHRAGRSRWPPATAIDAAFSQNAPLALAASHPLGPFALPFPARIYRVLQVFRMRRIHPEKGLLDIFHYPDVHLVRDDITKVDKPAKTIEEFAGFHFLNPIDQELSIKRRTGQTDLFQDRDFSAIQFDFATHGKKLSFASAGCRAFIRGRAPWHPGAAIATAP